MVLTKKMLDAVELVESVLDAILEAEGLPPVQVAAQAPMLLLIAIHDWAWEHIPRDPRRLTARVERAVCAVARAMLGRKE